MINQKTIRSAFVGALSALLLSTFAAGIWWYSHADGIYPYCSDRDRETVISLFDKNWYWLVSEGSISFSPEYMLDNRASSRSPEHVGNLNLFVYRAENNTAGFLAYYRKSALRGFILFLVVDDAYRGRGYARQLLEYALNDLKNQGVAQIELVTRLSNEKARGLYLGAGFHEIWRDEGYVRYEYDVA